MKNVLAQMEHCAAGTNFSANYAGDTTDQAVLELIRSLPDKTVCTSDDRYPHLWSCMKACESITGIPITSTTYLGIALETLLHWPELKQNTYAYRLFLELGTMYQESHTPAYVFKHFMATLKLGHR